MTALRSLSVFDADQGGAYREHFASLAATLGEDIETKLGRYVTGWAVAGQPGAVVLTGNAGTGKTAVAEAYCRALGAILPSDDRLIDIAPGRRVVKDLSGLPDPASRAATLRDALRAEGAQTLVCANEGVLRDGLNDIGNLPVIEALKAALRHGAAVAGSTTIVNVNRQRLTGDRLWEQLLDYVSREELWSGCRDCPFDAGGCPMRSNAAHLRQGSVRDSFAPSSASGPERRCRLCGRCSPYSPGRSSAERPAST